KENHPGIKQWLDESGAPNIIGPGIFKVGEDEFPNGNFDVVYTANTFHIMGWVECLELMDLLGRNLRAGALLLIYGPFNYQGKFTSKSNEKFDESLKSRLPSMGIRNFEEVNSCLNDNGFTLVKDYEMPAHNRF